MPNGMLIADAQALQMISFFDINNPVKEYELVKTIVETMIMNGSQVPVPSGFASGLYFHVGKSAPDLPGEIPGRFNLVAEPVLFKIAPSGHAINHADDIPYSRLGFDNALNISDRIFYPRSAWASFVAESDRVDQVPVKQIFLHCGILRQFLDNAPGYERMKISFARNALKGRLTVVLSCYNAGSATPLLSRIVNNGLVSEGRYEDENGLIPPPPF